MAGFRTHINFSTATGAVYGTSLCLLGIPAPTCIIAGGACSMAGMLPDIDSKSSRALQECLYIAAGLASLFMIDRLREFPLNSDLIVMLGAATFLFVRFIVGFITKHFTVHRGFMHSIPVAFIAGEITFLISSGPVSFRLLKAIGLSLGFLSHLLLDEIYSVDARGLRLKKSFGTALKFAQLDAPVKTVLVYCVLVSLAYISFNEQKWTETLKNDSVILAKASEKVLQKFSDQLYTDNTTQSKLDEALHIFYATGNSFFLELAYGIDQSTEMEQDDFDGKNPEFVQSESREIYSSSPKKRILFSDDTATSQERYSFVGGQKSRFVDSAWNQQSVVVPYNHASKNNALIPVATIPQSQSADSKKPRSLFSHRK